MPESYALIPGSADRKMLLHEIFPNENNVPIDALLFELKKDGYIFTPVRVDNNIAYDMHDHYSMTHLGMRFLNNSSISAKPFQAREVERLSKQAVLAIQVKSENFLKRHWMVLPLISFVFGIVSTLGTEFLKRKAWPYPKPNTQVIVIHDTIRAPVPAARKH